MGYVTVLQSRRLKWVLATGGVLLLITALLVNEMIEFADKINFYANPLPHVLRNPPFIKSPDLLVDKMVELAQVMFSNC